MATDFFYGDPYGAARPPRRSGYRSPYDEEENPESQTSGGGGEIPPEGFFDRNPGGPRDTAIITPDATTNPNPMLRGLGGGPSPWDFLTRSMGRVSPGAAVQGGGQPGGGMGQGRGPRPLSAAEFFDTGSGALDPEEYLAGQRGTTLQALRTWDSSQDAGYLAQVDARARAAASIGGLLNPIQYKVEYQRALADPQLRRQYQIRTQGYDPQTGRMMRPPGFDPLTDQGFLTASATLAAQRRGLRENAMAQLYGPEYTRRAGLEEVGRILSFFGLPGES